MKHCFLKVKQISTSTFLQKAFFLHYQGLYICPKAAYLIFLKIPLKRWFLWFMSPIFPSVGNQLSETWHPLSMHKAKQLYDFLTACVKALHECPAVAKLPKWQQPCSYKWTHSEQLKKTSELSRSESWKELLDKVSLLRLMLYCF